MPWKLTICHMLMDGTAVDLLMPVSIVEADIEIKH